MREAKWSINDDYWGMPHYTKIPDEELTACKTKKEKQQLIHNYVAQEFEELITYRILNMDDLLEDDNAKAE